MRAESAGVSLKKMLLFLLSIPAVEANRWNLHQIPIKIETGIFRLTLALL